jgi:hypothetical protein
MEGAMTDCRWTPAFAVLLCLFAVPARAQTVPAASCVDRGVACDDAQTVPASAAASAPQAKPGGHFPILLGAFITAASADLATSMYQIGRGTAREAAFGAPWQNSPVPFALSKSGMAAVFALGLQRMHKDRPRAAMILGVSATIMESMLVVRSARIASAR